MLKVIDKSLCNGCSACQQVCPKNCITLNSDKDGFLYPVIDNEKCINCNLCKKTCPVLNKVNSNKEVNAFAVINKNDSEREDSSSGGIFSLIAKFVLSKNGVVFGASFDENLVVKHLYIEKEEDLYKLRKSKYVQSELGDTFFKVKSFLEQGKLVLFTGTPCQVGGLQSFLKKPYDNLITQDIICHGVPSPKVLEEYKKYLENNEGSKIVKIDFRNKENSWENYNIKIVFENGKTLKESHKNNLYMQAFIKNLSLRQSCYNCAFKNKLKDSDITLADFWGVEKVNKNFNDDKGVSLVVINSKKGEEIFNKIKENIIYEQTNLEKAIIFNTSMIKSVKKPKKRDYFLKKVNANNFDKVYYKATKKSFFNKIKEKIKRFIKRLIKK